MGAYWTTVLLGGFPSRDPGGRGFESGQTLCTYFRLTSTLSTHLCHSVTSLVSVSAVYELINLKYGTELSGHKLLMWVGAKPGYGIRECMSAEFRRSTTLGLLLLKSITISHLHLTHTTTMPPRLQLLRRVAVSIPTQQSYQPIAPFLYPFLSQQRPASILSSLSDTRGAYNKRIRRGRGPASGKGKTSGRGHKGQKQHGKVPVGFNGGQTPDWVVAGKRGFKNQYARRPHRCMNSS